MDGVKRSLSSGRRQFSKVMSTPEYSRSPINIPCDPGAAFPEPGVQAAAAGTAGPGAPAATVAAAAAAILCRRLPFGLLPGRAAPRDALRPRPPRPSACHWLGLRAARRRLAAIGWTTYPSASQPPPAPSPARAGAGLLPRGPRGGRVSPRSTARPGSTTAGAGPECP